MMYEKSNYIPLVNSASFVPKNLSLARSRDLLNYVVVSKNSVSLTSIDRNGAEIDQKQIIPKISKEEKDSGSIKDSPESLLLVNITQAKFVNVSRTHLLVICSTKGIFFYDEDGNNLLHFHNLKNVRSTQIEETTYSRGITLLGPSTLAIGTSSGSIFLFEVESSGRNVSLKTEITEKELKSGISDLVSNENCLIAADTEGNIFGWHIRSERNFKLMFSIHGNKNACTCLGLWRKYLIAGYGNGLISIYDTEYGKKLVDISGHARWIHCLDISGDMLVTAGEDSYFRVWELCEVNGRVKVHALHSELISDSQMAGINFNLGSDQICISSFDSNQILVYNSL